MNGAEVVALLRSIDLGFGDHAVFGSGPLLIRGIIDQASDVDVIARGKAWEIAATAGDLVDLPDHGITIASFHGGKVTVGTSWALGHIDIDDAIDTADMIEGIPWVRLGLVMAYKTHAGRPKDREHLRSLQSWLDSGRS